MNIKSPKLTGKEFIKSFGIDRVKSPIHLFILFLVSIYVLLFSSVGDLGAIQSTKEKIIKAKSWSSTTGTVLSSDVTYKTKPYSQIFTRTGYQPDIKYSYGVAGKKYIGHNHWYDNDALYSIDDSHRSSTLYKGLPIRDYLTKFYPVNKTTGVIYNPANPAEAILERSNYADFNMQYYLALSIYVAAFVYILFYLKILLFNRNRKNGTNKQNHSR